MTHDNLQLVLLILAGMAALMIVLQTFLNRAVWWGYLLALPALLITWVLVR